MRLLLTGATGFLGGHILRALAADGQTLAVLLREGATEGALPVPAQILTHDGATATVTRVMGEFRPDAVVHLASLYLAAHTGEQVEALIRSNVLFGTQVLQAMADTGVTRLLNFGTSFQHFDGDGYSPVSLYAATKQAFEDIARYYVEARGFQVLTLKLSDTYGPDDPRGKIISLLLKIAHEGRSLDMSPGEQLVNFVHSDDVATAVRVGLAHLDAAPAGTQADYAVRGTELLSLRDLATLVQEVAGRPVDIRWGARDYRAREVMRPWLGPLLPGWSPRVDLRDGIGRINDQLR